MSNPSSPAGLSRLTHTVAGGASLVIALALVTLSLLQAAPLLPVALTYRLGGPGVFAEVDLAAAAAAVMLVSAAARLVIGLAPVSRPAPSLVGVRMLELSQASAITVFLVAQLNGVVEAGSLILVYAIAAAAVGVLWMHARQPTPASASPWPYSLGAAVAVVPWGIVALYQLVGLADPLTSAPPVIRVMTIVLLCLAAAPWLLERLVHREALSRARAELGHIGTQLASGVALVLLVVALARPSALL